MSTSPAQRHRAKAAKVDLKDQLKPLYTATAKPKAVTAGELRYLMIDGHGDPNTAPEFQAAIEMLFSVSYHLKFTLKKSTGVDYVVMPLEGLWWADDMARFSIEDKNSWNWTLMILQPAFITKDLFEGSRRAVAEKRRLNLDRLRYESCAETSSAQVMHVGPFSNEGPTVHRLHEWIAAAGKKLTGKHHEIYLSDFRRADPARWKTIIRQPYE